MSLTTPTSNKALLRVGLGTQTNYDALTGYTAGGIYIAAQGALAEATLAKIYVAQSTNHAYGLAADYADAAGKWKNGITLGINSAAGTTGITVDGSANKNLTIPSTMTGFASITSTTFVGNLTGLASNASRLSNTKAIGSATLPVYFSKNGVPVACNTELGVSITGNAATASKWADKRTLTLTGGVTGSVEFDGSGNISLATTVINSGKVNNPLTLTFGTATAVEGTNKYTFDGSAEKAIQFVAGDDYIVLTPTVGKVTIGAGSTLTNLQNTVNTINGNYVNKTNHATDIQGAKDYAKTYADGIYDKIAGGQLPEAFDTLKEIVDYLDGENGTVADAVLSKIDGKANADGSNVGTSTAKVTWANLNIGGSAAKWTNHITLGINSKAGATGIEVDGSANKNLTIPTEITGFTSITSTTFVGNLTGKASALNLSKEVGSTTLPVYFQVDGTPAACNTELEVDITGNAATATSADKWTNGIKLGINNIAGTTEGVVVNGSANKNLTIPATMTGFTSITSTTFVGDLTGTADVATKLGTANKGSATKPIYLAAGVPTECGDSLDVNITGNAATASNASHASKADSATSAATATSAGKWTNNMTVKIGGATVSAFNYNASGITFAAADIGSTVVWETF